MSPGDSLPRPASRDKPFPARVAVAVALLSAAVLAYEVLLTRLFTIIQWHHFAYMIISLALLGFGASGTFLSYVQGVLLQRFRAAFAANAACFGLGSVTAFALAERVPFNPLELFWDLHQPLYLLVVFGLLSVPFFCAANAIGLALARLRGHIPAVYCADLAGAGAGAIGSLTLLFWLAPDRALLVVGSLGLLAGALGAPGRRTPVVLATAALCLPVSWPDAWLGVTPSPYKPLSVALQVKGARVLQELSSPLGVLTVVENAVVPPRLAPGLSLRSQAVPPAQLEIYTDADAPTAINRFDGHAESVAYLDQLTSALPYHLVRRPKVLVLGAGGGSDVLQAIAAGARAVTAVEINPQTVRLVRKDYGAFAGHLYDRDDVRVVVSEARTFVEGSRERFDLIQLALVDSSGAAGAGLYALNESYIYTVDALRTYVAHLRPGGLLAITRWLNLPPRDCVKLFATAAEALGGSSPAPAAGRLALVRSWRTCTLLIKNGLLRAADTLAIRDFCRTRGFDVAYYPGIRPAEVNHYNLLPQPYLYQAAESLLGSRRDQFLAGYKFDITPATDNRPYFFHFFRWSALPELIELPARGGVALMEWGYVVLVATLAQALLLGVALILLPLWGRRVSASGPMRLGVASYFTALGLAFLFMEISFIQRFVLYLGAPLYAVSVVVAGFLLFASLGSLVSLHFQARLGRISVITAAFAAIALLCSAYLFLSPALLHVLPALPEPLRVAAGVALIAPLAFFMGMPFPLGLQRVACAAPPLIPWAWAVNGCASVVGAVGATWLSVHFGFAAVVLLAAALYAVAAASQRLLQPVPGG
jgi:hypothetical protein